MHKNIGHYRLERLRKSGYKLLSVFSLSVLIFNMSLMGVFFVGTGVEAAGLPWSDGFGAGNDDNNIDNWDESNGYTVAKKPGSEPDGASPDGGRFAKIGDNEWICAKIDARGYSGLVLKYYWRGDADAENNEYGKVYVHQGDSCTAGDGWHEVASHELDDNNNNNDEGWSALQAVNLPSEYVDNQKFTLRYKNNSGCSFTNWDNKCDDDTNDDNPSSEYFRVDGVSIALACTDNDQDGYSVEGGQCGPVDCNDSNPDSWQVDSYWYDGDNDGYYYDADTAGSDGKISICYGSSIPKGYAETTSGIDCNDDNSNINPAASEICGDSIDQDCDGSDLTCSCTDSDDDGFCDNEDNCPSTANPDQADADKDGAGNACDMCPGTDDAQDMDADGVPDDCDNCPWAANSGQEDSDQDGVGDACDNCPNSSNANQADSDGDGIGNVCDNCPLTSNANQADADKDGKGDVCDASDPVCGNQIIEEGEDCDGSACGTGETCVSCACVADEPACETGFVKIMNGGFENPTVNEHDGKWQIYPSGTDGLGWDVSWVAPEEGAPEPANLELQTVSLEWTAGEGSQWAELDTDYPVEGNEAASVVISQSVTTVPGAVYKLTFKFSPRPDTDSSNNSLGVKFGTIDETVSADGSGNTDTAWTLYEYTMTADSDSADLAFTDLGTPDSYGTLLDDVKVELTECPAEPIGSITICKYSDLDGNGALNENEPAVTDPLWHFYMNDTTYQAGETGCVTINEVDYGTYNISEEEDIDNWEQTGVDGNAVLEEDGSATVTVDGDNSAPIVYFLNHYTTPEDPTGSITIYKYNDVDENGEHGEEPYIPGWKVFISGDHYQYEGPETITDSEGKFTFSNLPYGEYTVCEYTQDGWTNTDPGNTPFDWTNGGEVPLMVVCEDVTVNGDITYYFGNKEDEGDEPTGTIRVCKYEDTDNNGEPDYPEYTQADSVLAKLRDLIVKPVLATAQRILHPLGGWTMNIAGDNGHNDSGATEGDDSRNHGCVDFTVPYGTYTITEDAQAGWTQTYPQKAHEVTIGDGEQYPNFREVYLLNHFEPVYGCMDSSATNYNSGATNDDQSCEYNQGGSGWLPSELTIYNERAGNLSGDFITITWLTNKAGTSRVIYDTVSHPDVSGESAPNYGYQWSTELDEEHVTGHSVTITGLTPNTTYYFRPMSSASPEIYGKQVEYKTGEAGSAPVENPEPISVSVLGEESVTLSLTKTVDRVKANPGDTGVKYTITVTNTDNVDAKNVVLSDTMEAGLMFSDAEGLTRTWELGDIAQGGKKEVSYTVNIDKTAAAKVYANTATVKADNSAADASATADLTVENVKVLAETGFDESELLILVLSVLGLFGIAKVLKFGVVKA
ncbi:MAG: thrombospondin type 3 repeat-containing protein [Candidatus Falkowbacteria bacterium]